MLHDHNSFRSIYALNKGTVNPRNKRPGAYFKFKRRRLRGGGALI